MTILVTGGTGRIGSRVVRKLVDAGAEVNVLVRDPGKAKLPGGATPTKGDLGDPGSIEAALDGISTLFLLNPVVADELTQAMLTLGLANDAGLKGVVYFSVLPGEHFSDVPHFVCKYTAERMIEALDMPATILKPWYFIQNDLRLKEAVTNGVYPMPIGDIGVAMVDADDIATIAAQAILAREQAPGRLPRETIDIAGPDDLTGESIASIWSEVLGKKVRYGGNDLDAFEQQVAAFAPGWLARDMYVMMRAYQRHGGRATAEKRQSLERRLGTPARSYRAFAEAAAKKWAAE